MAKTISMRFEDDECNDLETLVKSEGYSFTTLRAHASHFSRMISRTNSVFELAKNHPDEYEDWETVRKRL